MSRLVPPPSKEWLEGKYVTDGMTAIEIGGLMGVSKNPIIRLLRQYDIPVRRTGTRGLKEAQHPKWNGGIKHNSNGVYLRIGSTDSKTQYAKLARVLMEQQIGRALTTAEVVHHINYDKTDNRIENLQLLANQAEHARIHIKELNFRRWGYVSN